MSFKTMINLAGWAVFAIAVTVLGMAAEPTSSLWDCGEFISGAYKLQVVHPPGAPMFLLVGRMFAWVGSLVSSNPETIAYAVNLLSAVCTALGAMFVCWTTIYLAKIALVGRQGEGELDGGQKIAVAGAGLVAGLTTAFLPSIWFSAVEGEVYAMSFFFTCLTVWAVTKWYYLPDNAKTDRWLIFAIYATGLSVGVHLLSLLTFPALALFYYFKKTEEPTALGALLAALGGTVFIGLVQFFIIVGIPSLWAKADFFLVNSLGLPFNSGLAVVALVYGLATFLMLRWAHRHKSGLVQKIGMAFAVLAISYTCYGTVVIRAMANPPINMNNPSDPMRLLPYLNREQYGERPLLSGPNFDGRLENYQFDDRYGQVGDRYEVVDSKITPIYRDKVFFPRMSDYSQGRPNLYRQWVGKSGSEKLSGSDNFLFFFRYQINWMYWRYFFWNFAGRQNGEQGYFSTDPATGNWISGISFIDEMKVASTEKMPEYMRNDKSRNTYYFLPFLLGLIGLVFQYMRRPKEFLPLLALFIITGLGIIVYSNQPPSEPRERDYVLVGSFFVYAIWIGLSVPAIFEFFRNRLKFGGTAGAGASLAVGLVVPFLLVSQNWDDYSRKGHYGARDFASNFLNSCEKNAIVFTYGDNDTYPLWYAQEVEKIRTDVRVVNLSLLAVDWYIDQLRRKVNESDAIKMTISADQMRGFKRQQVPILNRSGKAENQVMSLADMVKYLSEDHEIPMQQGRPFDTHVPATNLYLPVNKAAALKSGVVSEANLAAAADTIRFTIAPPEKTYLQKDELAILDIVHSNIWDRPIYWAVTCREEKLMGLNDYMQLEGLALRLVPIKSQSIPQYGMIGCGRVDLDKAFTNITEKFRWGGFDKHETYINTSYYPSIQTMRVAMIRTAQEMVQREDNTRAVAMADKYMEAFPRFNYPYDYFTTMIADIYILGGAEDKAKALLRALAQDAEEHLVFYDSLGSKLRGGYSQDQGQWLRMVQDIMRAAGRTKDTALLDELQKKLGPWAPKSPQMPEGLEQLQQ